MIPDFESEEEAVCMLKKLQAFSVSNEHYERGIYLGGCLIGFVNDVEIKDGLIELGYVIHPDHKGNGYATEMLEAVIQDLFCKGYQSIVAGAFSDNTASFRVMQKCGMLKSAKEEAIFYQGVLHRCYYYIISRE